MFKRRLGRSNLEVSAMGLGCWAIGGPWTYDGEPAGWGGVDDAESIRALFLAGQFGMHVEIPAGLLPIGNQVHRQDQPTWDECNQCLLA